MGTVNRAARPSGRTACRGSEPTPNHQNTKPRQDHFSDQGLPLEQQERAKKNCESVVKREAQIYFHLPSCSSIEGGFRIELKYSVKQLQGSSRRWDAVILAEAFSAGSDILYSEDMQDGQVSIGD